MTTQDYIQAQKAHADAIATSWRTYDQERREQDACHVMSIIDRSSPLGGWDESEVISD